MCGGDNGVEECEWDSLYIGGASQGFDDDVDSGNQMGPCLRVGGCTDDGEDCRWRVSWLPFIYVVAGLTFVRSQLFGFNFRTGDTVHGMPCST